MQFKTEQGTTFTTVELEQAIEARTNIDFINDCSRYFYRQYVHIRNCNNPKKCKRVSMNQVRERLSETFYLELTTKVTRLDEQQIKYVINFCERYIAALR